MQAFAVENGDYRYSDAADSRADRRRSNGVPRGPLAPLLIGLLIAVIGASGPLTGFAMNPRVTLAPNVAGLAGWVKLRLPAVYYLTAPFASSFPYSGAFAYRKIYAVI